MSETRATELPLRMAYAFLAAVPYDLGGVRERLEVSGGGVEIVHATTALELRIEVLCAPGQGEVRVETGDAVYVVLDGTGMIDVEGTVTSLLPSEAVFVPVGARHALLGNPRLSLLVISTPRWSLRAGD